MKHTFPVNEDEQLKLLLVFSKIPLKLEGGFIAPLQLALGESDEKNASVLFKNVTFEFDQQEPIGINIDGKSVFDIDGMIYCQGSCLALENATIFDFIRFCQLENVSLEFTDYAIAMISKFKMKKMEFEEYMAFCEDEDSGDNFTIEVGYFNVLLSDTLLDKAVENAALKNSLVQMTGNHFEITNAGPTGRKSTEIRIQQQHGDLHPDAAEQLNDFNHG